jgi:radical SAM protein (TIGR01212 family)
MAYDSPRRRKNASEEEEVAVRESRFNRHADRLVERQGERVWRLGIDGGFGCPNRGTVPDGVHAGRGRGAGGCIYCATEAATAPYLGGPASLPSRPVPAAPPGSPGALEGIDAQLRAGLAFTRRRYGARLFFPYFQAYSSTWAPLEALKASYDRALSLLEEEAPGSGRGLVVSTRPDCVDAGVAGLLASYAGRGLEVWVELGLQSGLDSTLARIRRGHSVADFIAARRLLARTGIRVAAHLILGLPGESRDGMLEGVRLVASLGLEGVKFHDLHIPRGTELAREYLAGEISLLPPESYLEVLADAVELLPPSTEIIRVGTDTEAGERLAPRRVRDKSLVYEGLEALLARRGTRQGSRYRGQPPPMWGLTPAGAVPDPGCCGNK